MAVLAGMVLSLSVQAMVPAATAAPSARPTVPLPAPTTAGAATVGPATVSPATVSPVPPVTSPPPPTAVDCTKVKCVALTFDDGPVKNTSHVLDALSARGARATFFVLGMMAKKRPGLLRRMIAEGNAVGDHSWNHPLMFGSKATKIRSQFVRTQQVITAATGERPMLVRPPFGQQDKKVRKTLAKLGSPVILWNVDPEDWKVRKADVVIRRVLKATKRNSIILLHDVWPSTRAAVPAIIDKLQAKGFVLVTVPELLGGSPTPGKVYLHG